MPPVPPANRSKKGPKSNPETSRDKKLVKHEHHANAAEEGIPPISSRIPRTRVTSAAGVWVDRETDWPTKTLKGMKRAGLRRLGSV
jgi:hypothetical protein